jgi:hypothetical protein
MPIMVVLMGGTGGTTMIAFRAVSIALRTPVPPVPLGGTTCSQQILCSTTGTAGPTEETIEGTDEDVIASRRRLLRTSARVVVGAAVGAGRVVPVDFDRMFLADFEK